MAAEARPDDKLTYVAQDQRIAYDRRTCDDQGTEKKPATREDVEYVLREAATDAVVQAQFAATARECRLYSALEQIVPEIAMRVAKPGVEDAQRRHIDFDDDDALVPAGSPPSERLPLRSIIAADKLEQVRLAFRHVNPLDIVAPTTEDGKFVPAPLGAMLRTHVPDGVHARPVGMQRAHLMCASESEGEPTFGYLRRVHGVCANVHNGSCEQCKRDSSFCPSPSSSSAAEGGGGAAASSAPVATFRAQQWVAYVPHGSTCGSTGAAACAMMEPDHCYCSECFAAYGHLLRIPAHDYTNALAKTKACAKCTNFASYWPRFGMHQELDLLHDVDATVQSVLAAQTRTVADAIAYLKNVFEITYRSDLFSCLTGCAHSTEDLDATVQSIDFSAFWEENRTNGGQVCTALIDASKVEHLCDDSDKLKRCMFALDATPEEAPVRCSQVSPMYMAERYTLAGLPVAQDGAPPQSRAIALIPSTVYHMSGAGQAGKRTGAAGAPSEISMLHGAQLSIVKSAPAGTRAPRPQPASASDAAAQPPQQQPPPPAAQQRDSPLQKPVGNFTIEFADDAKSRNAKPWRQKLTSKAASFGATPTSVYEDMLADAQPLQLRALVQWYAIGHNPSGHPNYIPTVECSKGGFYSSKSYGAMRNHVERHKGLQHAQDMLPKYVWPDKESGVLHIMSRGSSPGGASSGTHLNAQPPAPQTFGAAAPGVGLVPVSDTDSDSEDEDESANVGSEGTDSCEESRPAQTYLSRFLLSHVLAAGNAVPVDIQSCVPSADRDSDLVHAMQLFQNLRLQAIQDRIGIAVRQALQMHDQPSTVQFVQDDIKRMIGEIVPDDEVSVYLPQLGLTPAYTEEGDRAYEFTEPPRITASTSQFTGQYGFVDELLQQVISCNAPDATVRNSIRDMLSPASASGGGADGAAYQPAKAPHQDLLKSSHTMFGACVKTKINTSASKQAVQYFLDTSLQFAPSRSVAESLQTAQPTDSPWCAQHWILGSHSRVLQFVDSTTFNANLPKSQEKKRLGAATRRPAPAKRAHLSPPAASGSGGGESVALAAVAAMQES